MKKQTDLAILSLAALCVFGLATLSPAMNGMLSHALALSTLVRMSLSADVSIAVSYALAVGCLVWALRQVRSIPLFREYVWLTICFVAITALRTGIHATRMVTIGPPVHALPVLFKVACAIVSVSSAFLLGRCTYALAPRIVALRETIGSAQEEKERAIEMTASLERSEQTLRLLVEGVNDHALLTIDPQGVVTSWNRGAERLLGYREDEIVGRNSSCIFTPEDIQLSVPERQIATARQIGRAEEEGWRVRASGDRFWANVNKTAFYGDSGQVLGFAVIIHDTTEKRRVASAIEETRLERVRLQEKFLSNVSHELRTPLTAIYFFISNVSDGLLGDLLPEQREHLLLAMENVDQLKQMVDDLLDITRVDTHKLTVQPQHANPIKLISDAVSTCRKHAMAKSIRLGAETAPELPFAWADPLRVRQVLINLIDNATKFTSEGGSIVVNAQVFAEDPGFLRFSVTDTGCGIKKSDHQIVFDRLSQIKDGLESSRGGLGIGLFIARELVQHHGGRIWLESEPGCGSTFFFTLPVFSVAKLCAHVLTPQNLSSGCATLIAVDIVTHDATTRGELLPVVHKVLERCVHPGQDVLLPWMGDMDEVTTFFIAACTDTQGFSVIANRIGMELKHLDGSGKMKPYISSTTVMVNPGASGDGLVAEVTARFERLMNEHLQRQEQYQ